MPTYINPAEFLLDLTSSDFAHGNDDEEEAASSRIDAIHSDWKCSAYANSLTAEIQAVLKPKDEEAGRPRPPPLAEANSRAPFAKIVLALLHRSFIKSYRDVVAYGIRFAMYIG